MFHLWNMDHYRMAATGEFPECMEVHPDETPWTEPRFVGSITVPHSGPTDLPLIERVE